MRNVAYIVIILCFVMISCVKDIDLDQVDDIEIYTDHNVSLVYFTLDVSNFLDDLGSEINVLSDTTRIPIFVGSYTENFLIQADFKFKTTNTFDRPITFQYEFLDEDNNSIYSFQPIITPPNSINSEFAQTIVAEDIPSVLVTEKIVVSVSIDSDTSPLDPNEDYIFNLQSAVILHYKVTVEDE